MSGGFGSLASRCLAVIWSATTIVYSAVVSAVIIGDANFRLNIGVITMTGRASLWPILVPAVIGLIGLLLVLRRVRWGGWLLGAYSLFWAGVLAAGLPGIWNAKTSFCTRTICITTPWIGRLLLFALPACFLLLARWAYLNARLHPAIRQII
jgi:hypothetical protein